MKVATALLSLLLLVSIYGCSRAGSERGPDAGSPTVDVTGRWNVGIAVGAETIAGHAVLAQSGDRVSGSMGPNEDNLHPLEGTVTGRRIALTMRPGPGVSTAFDAALLTLDGESLSGTVEGGRAHQGIIELTRIAE